MTSLPTYPRVHRQTDDETARECHVDVLCVGPWHDREFALVRSSIEQANQWQTAVGIDQAMDYLAASGAAPELVLLAQPLSGGYRQVQIDRLQRLAPLARIVVVAGTWCEGELRNLKPLAGVLRLYWYEVPAWWRAARAAIRIGVCPPWSAPLDGPRAGRFCRDFFRSAARVGETVAIDAADFGVYLALHDGLSCFGWKSVWHRRRTDSESDDQFACGIWDGGQLSARELRRLNRFARLLDAPTRPLVVLLDFPREEHFPQALAAGATAVFGKPYIVNEVVAALVTQKRL